MMSPNLIHYPSPNEDRIHLPSNTLLFGTHASQDLPARAMRYVRKEFQHGTRLGRNFSDVATAELFPDYLPEDQYVLAPGWRLGGDPNRSKRSKELHREVDFNGVPVLRKALPQRVKSALIKELYDPYHNRIQELLAGALEKNPEGPVIFFDIHDTGNCMMKPDPRKDSVRTPEFPDLCLSFREGKACDPKIFYAFVGLMAKYLKVLPQIDNPYKGGYILQRYSEQYNAQLPEEERFKRINGIQVEIGRFLYMDEKTQTIIPEEMERVQRALLRAVAELGVMYGVRLPEAA